MWLQNFKIQDKSLSPVELLVLTALSEEYTEASDILKHLDQQIDGWYPERGTIYPILHRLTSKKLLEKQEGSKLGFKRSNYGTSFLSSITDTFIIQIIATKQYFEMIADGFIKADPIQAIDFLKDFKSQVEKLSYNLSDLIIKAEETKSKDNWHNISID
ncbi:MAG: PadR family transcriptional regulator [Candidatus Heimdallarchaeota archaeon]|nr:PadR family transcriptional regulator [Candidatus Heimdallarchaeota archaeon]MDH5644874.1 PadR family transcriptional regulator [Candidatus Heimdallarchaeota archaeon]